jgi:hypothetical protein
MVAEAAQRAMEALIIVVNTWRENMLAAAQPHAYISVIKIRKLMIFAITKA